MRLRFRSLSLGRKMVLVSMATTAVALVMSAMAFALWDLASLRREKSSNLRMQAEAVAANCAAAVMFGDEAAAAEQLSMLRFDSEIEGAALFAADGRRFTTWHSSGGVPGTPALPPEQGTVLTSDALVSVVPVILDGEQWGTLWVRHGLGFLRERKLALLGTLGLAALVAAGLALLIVARLQRVVSAPILRLTGVAQDVSQRGDCSVRAPRGDDGAEVNILIDAFNGMLVRIEEREAELRSHRDNLEHMVAARTAELSSTNEQLRTSMLEAQAAAVAKSQFLATMSHEIRTPMNGIIGMASLLMETELNREQRDMGQTVLDSADGLLRIINDVLDYSKIDAGRLELESIDFDARTVLEGACDLIYPLAAKKNLELVCLESGPVRTAVRGDPARMRQVVLNLLGNAVKFTEKGEVVVTLSQEDETDEHVVLRVEVSDSGIGIPEEARDRLFRTFSQVDASTTRRYGGTGLGLAISRQLVEAMGGRIGVTSRPQQGSAFWFTVRLQKQATRTCPLADLPPALHGLRVLVVDDNETNRRVLQGYLERWNLSPTLTCGGVEALAELRRAAVTPLAYQLVVLDMNMPEMDGEQVARAIRSDPALKGTRIVILTSGWKRREANLWEELGVAGHLTKPVKPSQFFDCIALVMGTHAATHTAPVTVTEATLEHAEERARLRILLVEDNPVNQKVASAVLRRGGYRCDIVSDGAQAVERVSAQRYDIVLMDCQMPEMDGFEATRRIRDMESGRPGEPRLPILAMTANALTGDRERCLAAGMDDFVSKPVKPETLYELLGRWVMPRGNTERPVDTTTGPATT